MEFTSVVSPEILKVADVSTWDPESDEFFPFILEVATAEEVQMQPEEPAPNYAESTKESRRKFRRAAQTMYKTKYLDFPHAVNTMKQLLPVWEAAIQFDRELFEKLTPSQYSQIKDQMGKFRKIRKVVGGAIIEYVSRHQKQLTPAGKRGLAKFQNCLNSEAGLADEILLEEEFQNENSRFLGAEDFLKQHPEYFF